MTSEELNAIAALVAQKLWDKFAAASLLRSVAPQPAAAISSIVSPQSEPMNDYVSTEIITAEFGVSKQWLYKQRLHYPQCSRLVKHNKHDQRGKRFWSRSFIKKIIHESQSL